MDSARTGVDPESLVPHPLTSVISKDLRSQFCDICLHKDFPSLSYSHPPTPGPPRKKTGSPPSPSPPVSFPDCCPVLATFLLIRLLSSPGVFGIYVCLPAEELFSPPCLHDTCLQRMRHSGSRALRSDGQWSWSLPRCYGFPCFWTHDTFL